MNRALGQREQAQRCGRMRERQRDTFRKPREGLCYRSNGLDKEGQREWGEPWGSVEGLVQGNHVAFFVI